MLNNIMRFSNKAIMVVQIAIIALLALTCTQTYNKIQNSVSQAQIELAKSKMNLISSEIPKYAKNKYCIICVAYLTKYYKTATVSGNNIVLVKNNGTSDTFNYKSIDNIKNIIKKEIVYINIPNIAMIFIYIKLFLLIELIDIFKFRIFRVLAIVRRYFKKLLA